MKTRIFLLLVLLISNFVWAQGYRNRKFLFSYQPGYSFIGYFDPENIIPILHHKINFGFSLSKHFSIDLNTQYSSGKKEQYYSGNIGHYYTPKNASKMIINDQLAGIQLKYFRIKKKAFAPSGQYFSIGFEYGKSNSYRTESVFVPYYDGAVDGNTYLYEIYDDKVRVPICVVSLYAGRNFILKERFLLGFGIQAGYVLSGGKNQYMRHFGKPFFNLGFIF